MLYPVERSRERCASYNLLCDDENLLLVAAFYNPISSFWERPCCSSGHVMEVQIFTTDLVFNLMIGQHLILFFPQNCLWVFAVRSIIL